MKVTWKEICEVINDTPDILTDGELKPRISTSFEYRVFVGEVIEKFKSFFGSPKFVVGLEDGTIKVVPMEKCTIVGGAAPLQVRIKKLHPDAVIPFYAKPNDAGMDLTAISKHDDADGNVVYGFGLAFEIPKGYAGFIFPRSSNASHSLLLSNSVGVVDSGYRGEVSAKFRKDYQYIQGPGLCHNLSGEYEIGERVAQIIITPYPQVEFVESEELSKTERGANGYGHTGK